MTQDEFVNYMAGAYGPDEIVSMLIRYGICDSEDIIDALSYFIVDLQEYIDEEDNVDE